MDNIKITYNNKTDEFPRGITVLEVSKKYSKYYKYDILEWFKELRDVYFASKPSLQDINMILHVNMVKFFH